MREEDITKLLELHAKEKELSNKDQAQILEQDSNPKPQRDQKNNQNPLFSLHNELYDYNSPEL